MNIDPKIIKACIKGKRKGEYELYKKTFPYLMDICLRYEKNRENAMELLNIAFLKILRNLKNFRMESSFKTWAGRIVINTIFEEFRKNKRQRELFINTDFSSYTDFGTANLEYNNIDELFSAEQLDNMLNSLPEKLKLVFKLFEIEGYSHKEIGEMIGASDRSSKRYLAEARERLKLMLEESQVCSLAI